MEIGWKFPLNNDGPITGISEAGVETFNGTPYKSLAREICQNSLDAAKDESKPVRVEFSILNHQSHELDKREELSDAFKKCSEFWDQQKDKKTRNFFQKAYALINKDTIRVLKISDFNTTGLDGSDKQLNSNWCNLVKSSGVSDKGGSAGGSFGIGKSAPFVCSDFRSVIYSTLDHKGVKASQGVSRLVSFNTVDGITQGIGYYGNKDKNQPIKNEYILDKGSERQESGTDIYILGFRDGERWKQEIIAAILEGFLVAIWKGFLEVVIDDVLISKDTIGNVISKYGDEIDSFTKNYYRVLTSDNTKMIEWNFEKLGNVVLYLDIHEDFHRKVCVTRASGMKIFDKDRISGYIPFAGVLILEGHDANKFFRSMETPQHDKWEYERHEDSKLAKNRLSILTKAIKEHVLNLQMDTQQDEMDVEGIGEYLPDEIVGEKEDKDKREELSNRVKRIDIKRVDLTKKTKVMGEGNNYGEDGFMDVYGEDMPGGTNEGIINGSGDGKASGGTGKPGEFKEGLDKSIIIEKPVEIKPMEIRLFCSNKSLGEYTLRFKTPKNLKNAYVKVMIAGEQGGVDAIIKSACISDNGKRGLVVKEGKIIVDKLIKDISNKFQFIIDYDNYCSMEVKVYGFEV
ncbi:hypothetical protein KPL33_13105 [Clostridium algidicarnis]|uniref:hypothetical protein n=1 Tax=Clostridium algidicarnis TaxID=37659 RepID=UPI001C0D9132|nr:hypothetical protein [Clostridium algidicarnis]MBU3207900.1 hypothetical protein [Clostridium algidicarnis]